MEKLFITYLGLVGFGLVLYYVFVNPQDTAGIITNASQTGGDFIATLPATDQDKPDLGQLAGIATTAVRLDVDGDELRLSGGCRSGGRSNFDRTVTRRGGKTSGCIYARPRRSRPARRPT